MELSEKLSKIEQKLIEYKNSGCRGVILGISGGKDSTVVAMLAKKVWGENVLGVLMPNGVQSDIDDSRQIVKALNIKNCTVNIGDAYLGLLDSISLNGEEYKISEKAKTNIPPRLRMTVLYAIGQTVGYRVIGTGNASELYLGWFTKWGDGACDINPIANLTCTEVIEVGKILCKEFGLDEKYVIKTPADGLTGKSDEENFGFDYETLDGVIRQDCPYSIEESVYNQIQKMHEITEHKRKMPIFIDID